MVLQKLSLANTSLKSGATTPADIGLALAQSRHVLLATQLGAEAEMTVGHTF